MRIYSLILCCVLVGISAYDLPEVEIPDGKIVGEISTSYDGNKYMAFIGIPYAKPPIGELRFEEPQNVDPWPGTWTANMSTTCLQVQHWYEPEGGKTSGQEDCLYMQVFVPGTTINKDAKLDVIVHLHSGGFHFGAGQSYAGPKYLMDKNVILVSANYRLGIFGFLSTADQILPGNLGMKDQNMALKWVKNNIKHFGGNDNSITLTGLSAGSVSTHYHYFSPLSRGLFNRGISVSGCTINPWSLQENPLRNARRVAEAVGCNFNCTRRLVKCLKTRPDSQLVEVIRLLRTWLYNPFAPLAPVVDTWSKNPFLPENPYKMLLDGNVYDVPWIASVTTSEGLYPAADYAVKDHYLPDLETHWNEYLPGILHYDTTIKPDNWNSVSAKIKEYYLGNKAVSKETFPEVIQMVGDRIFVVGVEEAARLQAKAVKSPIHFYQYNYTGEVVESFAEHYSGSPIKYGVSHGDDVMFVFNNPNKNKLPVMTKRDTAMKEFLLNIWTSYAKSGDIAVPNWVPVSKDLDKELNYMYIGAPEDVEMRTAKELGHRSFWESIPFEENNNLLHK